MTTLDYTKEKTKNKWAKCLNADTSGATGCHPRMRDAGLPDGYRAYPTMLPETVNEWLAIKGHGFARVHPKTKDYCVSAVPGQYTPPGWKSIPASQLQFSAEDLPKLTTMPWQDIVLMARNFAHYTHSNLDDHERMFGLWVLFKCTDKVRVRTQQTRSVAKFARSALPLPLGLQYHYYFCSSRVRAKNHSCVDHVACAAFDIMLVTSLLWAKFKFTTPKWKLKLIPPPSLPPSLPPRPRDSKFRKVLVAWGSRCTITSGQRATCTDQDRICSPGTS